jgi:hypothetical protein
MKLLCLLLLLICAGFSQPPQPHPRTIEPDENAKLPNGKSQREEMLKADHKKNLEDAAELVKMSEELKADLEKNDRYIVSLKTLKKTEDIEKLAKNIRGRLKRY